ncbi:PASTA domain-containing protein [Leifsonia shinshuensis]|uniref:protein kinase domain-containing protein n=1 Tax=Leifsonia shinshuensis TaxID=150026 RepID=UPI001F510ADA|nr:PASTA domain-containing protein [Leifsonia shinshuensis]MCI0157007.1 PASTA domain-containing protein [Leifsonia shinshuensis]
MSAPDDSRALAGRFELEALLGSGATATVFRARDRDADPGRPDGGRVAVKVLHPQLAGTAAQRASFYAEAHAMRRVAHPGVPAIVATGEDAATTEEERAWIASALALGETLADRVERTGALPEAEALDFTAGLLDVLVAVHAAGIVHRDIAPGNVMIGGNGEVALLDFGLADEPDRAATGDDVLRSSGTGGGVIGSVNYLSPEQALGEPVDERGDLYQVAGVLHFALTARPPFARASVEQTMAAHVGAPPSVPSAHDSRLSRATDDLVVRGLLKDPSARFPSAAAMARAVRAALAALAEPALASSRTRVLPVGGRTEVLPRRRSGDEARSGLSPSSAAAVRATPAARPQATAALTRSTLSAAPAAAPGVASRRGRPGRLAVGVLAVTTAVVATIWLIASSATTAPPPLAAPSSTDAPSPAATPVATTRPTPPAPMAAPPVSVAVPDLAGATRPDAQARLAAAGLTTGAVREQDSTAAAGTVLSSSPEAGAAAPRGSAVVIVVASGFTTVPDVAGRAGVAAGATLSAAGFTVAERTVADATVPDRTVLGTEPGAGARLALGSTVTVVLSRAPSTPAPTPSGPTAAPTPSRSP